MTYRSSAIVAGLLVLASAAASAPRHAISGRTGLLSVRDGKNMVRAREINVDAVVRGRQITITQTYRLQLPHSAKEAGPVEIEVALREDDYQRVSVAESPRRGFASFSATLDNSPLAMQTSAWTLNRPGDTATRWRTAQLTFKPGQTRSLRIQTVAQTGVYGNKPLVQFTAKDLGGWLGKPDLLQVRLRLPGSMEARVAGVEPKTTDINRAAIRWVYRMASMRRDVFVLLPPK